MDCLRNRESSLSEKVEIGDRGSLVALLNCCSISGKDIELCLCCSGCESRVIGSSLSLSTSLNTCDRNFRIDFAILVSYPINMITKPLVIGQRIRTVIRSSLNYKAVK